MKISRRTPEQPLDQQFPDYAEEELLDTIIYPFELIANVNARGDVTYETKGFGSNLDDEEYGNWYCEKYPGLEIATADDVADAIDQLIVNTDEYNKISGAGEYQLTGTAYIVIKTDLGFYADVEESDITNSEVEADSEIDFDESYIEDFKVVKLGTSVESAKKLDNVDYDVIYAADGADDEYEPYTGEHDEYEDVWDSIADIDQEFTSANTSINSSKLPALFSMVEFDPETVNVDYGGGRFDNVADYLTDFDVVNLVIDPFNRNKKHNRDAINLIRDHGGADSATCSNVLNVIKEPENRRQVLENMKKLVKPGGKIYITVYEGDGTGEEGATSSGYQLRRKTKEYLDEIREVFPDAERKGKLISATNSGKIPNPPTL